ncbi:MAG: TatD family hydrolase [Spirochaetaceae bacterium]|nr:TatD family hydrolase [Spirochaetaceae bacterium]
MTDAHLHFVDLAGRDPGFAAAYAAGPYLACAASHDEEEFLATEALAAPPPGGRGLRFAASFGIHPQWAVWKHADFLAGLCAAGRIAAIGEAGFDLFGDRPERVRNEGNLKVQRAVFEFQLGLARRWDLPMVLHVRKAADLVFAYARELAALPAVVMHAYSGTAREAADLLGRGVPAYFSFGASLANGHKRAIEACAALPADRLLAETDAPWQPPRGEPFCKLEHITLVIGTMAGIRGVARAALEERLADNFAAAYPKAAGLVAVARAGAGTGEA